MSKNHESPNWSKNKDLPFLEKGLHADFPFKGGFPDNHKTPCTVVTAWGERLTNVFALQLPSDEPLWDVSKCRSRSGRKSRIGKQMSLHEGQVACWKQHQ